MVFCHGSLNRLVQTVTWNIYTWTVHATWTSRSVVSGLLKGAAQEQVSQEAPGEARRLPVTWSERSRPRFVVEVGIRPHLLM